MEPKRMKRSFLDDRFLEGFAPAPRPIFIVLVLFSLFMVWNPLIAWSNISLHTFQRIYAATRGLVHPTLINSLFIFTFCLLLFLLGRLKQKPIGFTANKIPEALVILLVSWAAVQLLGLASCLVTGTQIKLHPDWKDPFKIGQLFLTYYLGVGLAEEFHFRAFLFPQLLTRLKSKPGWSQKKALFWSIFASQLLFGLMHIRVNVSKGTFGGNIPLILSFCIALGICGVFFVLLYLRSENLWVTILLHGLIDNPLILVKTPIAPDPFAFLVALLVLLFWPFASLKKRGEAKPAGEIEAGSKSE